jgi:hypothetical protein
MTKAGGAGLDEPIRYECEKDGQMFRTTNERIEGGEYDFNSWLLECPI